MTLSSLSIEHQLELILAELKEIRRLLEPKEHKFVLGKVYMDGKEIEFEE